MNNLINENQEIEIIEKLEHFDELDFFLKKYNGMFRTIELVQDVFGEKELKRFNDCATYLKYSIFKDNNNLKKKVSVC